MPKKLFPLVVTTILTTTLASYPAVASTDTYEPNDTKAQAYYVSADTTYTSYLSTGTDVDYYQYYRSFTGTQTFTFTPPNDGNVYNVQVIDPNNTVMTAGSTSSTGGPLTLAFNVSTIQTPYYIKIYSNGNVSANPYQLVMGHYDTGEVNNTQAQAYSIADGHFYNAVLATTSDVDYYAYNATKNGVATITLTQPGDAAANFSIYDDLGKSFAGGTIGGGGSDATSTPFQFSVTAGRKYYVKYFPTSTVSSSYYNISFENLDANEPNDSFAQATSVNLGLNSYFLYNSQDVDYYKFHANTTGTVSLDILPQAPGSIGWSLYQGTGTQLAGGSVGFQASSSPYSFSVTSGSDYYIKVVKQTGDNSQMCYTMELK
ncbi:hypothetical protein JJB07_15870 [Tumebacillus sp. ITR2]|uniref:Peptidase C-terminal archaeal/bacterial domain-containing protein n=1 Tax=Tumebacillus amylolyticus TaxID=2801339 RepID=A0ABS1JCX4_9BACL|nr:hypothetical protein [Tumebacillus amylolyticus]MBL0388095.1 hypothetical protein [Tumebacillus amylolyticus]